MTGRIVITMFIILFLSGKPSLSGPWPRETGTGFLSTTLFANGDRQTFNGFGEWGLRPKLTLGTRFELGLNDGPHSGSIFLRWAQRDIGQWKWAVEGGLGAVFDAGDVSPRLLAGASLGRGLTLADYSAWTSFDLLIKSDGLALDEIKLDATFGLTPKPRQHILLRLNSSLIENMHYIDFAPGFVFSAGENRQIEIGANIPISGNGETKLVFGNWWKF